MSEEAPKRYCDDCGDPITTNYGTTNAPLCGSCAIYADHDDPPTLPSTHDNS